MKCEEVIDYCENKFLRHFYRIYFQICPQFARIISTKPYFSSPGYIPKNYLKTKLFNIDADEIDARKWQLNPQSKITLSVNQLLNSVKNNSIF